MMTASTNIENKVLIFDENFYGKYKMLEIKLLGACQPVDLPPVSIYFLLSNAG